ncbi:hypothetical protein [Mucilaginibacter sp. UYCu711]|uniref:hypothetical protein n=1 Tax=Mucilaginibacter sp. UYCu711 TaxID=3156339 RepID=UPI003D21C374
MSLLAPIVLFVYNRPAKTQIALNTLAANPEAKQSILYIYCDGEKAGASNETLEKIKETRIIAKNENRFKEVKVIEQAHNKGLSNSIITAVTEICNKYGSIIVLEDDIVTAPFFLCYMNEALQLYKDVDNVGCISGYWYPIKKKLPEIFFLRNFSCWGWATWSRAWNIFEEDGCKILLDLKEKKLTKQFDLDGSIKYTQMLKDQISGKNNSWAIRWDAINFVNKRLCIYPNVSLVKNIGFDGNGTHSTKTNYYDAHLADKPIIMQQTPAVESIDARNELIQFYKKLNRNIFFKRLFSFLTLKLY